MKAYNITTDNYDKPLLVIAKNIADAVHKLGSVEPTPIYEGHILNIEVLDYQSHCIII